MFKPLTAATSLVVALFVTGCDEPAPVPPPIRPVRTVTVEQRAVGETISLTGHIRSQDQANLAFRIDGRLIERPVKVGDVIRPGEVIGRLDPQIQQNNLRQAQANLSAAEGQLVQARNTFARQSSLLRDGFTPRSQFDQAQQALQTVEAQVNSAKAQLRTAEEQLGYTELRADSAGTVTAVGVEPGEVVAAGRMVVQVARQGGRDAVFDVPAQLLRASSPEVVVDVAMTDDPRIRTTGRVREVAPQADPITRTYPVKVGLIDAPEQMRLGATVTGRVTLNAPDGIDIPATALTKADGRPAVWVVDPRTRTVALRAVEILRHDPAGVVVSQGLQTGEVVVTAGVQVLRPGQEVRLMGSVP